MDLLVRHNFPPIVAVSEMFCSGLAIRDTLLRVHQQNRQLARAAAKRPAKIPVGLVPSAASGYAGFRPTS